MRTPRRGDPAGTDTASAHFGTQRTVPVPLFRSLMDSLTEDRRWVILDLGTARPQMIDLLSRFRCRLDIADLAESAVASLDRVEGTVRVPDPVESLRAMPDTEPVDIVLSWDFLNYMSPEQITRLMRSISTRCRPGAFVHALIAYSDSLMPQRPGQFAPIDEGRLLNLSTATPDRHAPRYSIDDLDRCSPGFTIERIRLLTSGMQEYLFRLLYAVDASR
ncbi:hypothetical protein [Candidatus Rariloculus sp.]|uniref:hypothetical protein n=1 Tax=Candidatus Rariloculus sp. TaxID=3101265 RepID=UPI003D0CD2CC